MGYHGSTVYPKKYAHGFNFAVLCCGYTLTDFLISTRLTSLALWQSNDCPSASKATLMNMDKYFMWIHYERLHDHNKAKHNKTVCIFLGIYCTSLALNYPCMSLELERTDTGEGVFNTFQTIFNQSDSQNKDNNTIRRQRWSVNASMLYYHERQTEKGL